jgi:methyl halide transferase
VLKKNLPSPNYWDERYRQNETAWDMGQISPPLKTYFEQLKNKRISILIPGCGNSYEAAWLLEQGFLSITLIDISEVLVTSLQEKFQRYIPPLNLITGDFFALTGQYDLIIEQTFFCALEPSQRKEYVEKMYSLLRPGGRLAGLLFDRDFTGGPPFGGSKEEYQQLLEKRFEIRTLEPCYNSIKPRAGTELFFITEKVER